MNDRNNDLYKRMYYRLFNLVSDVINICDDERAKNKLIVAQQITEEMYIDNDSCENKCLK